MRIIRVDPKRIPPSTGTDSSLQNLLNMQTIQTRFFNVHIHESLEVFKQFEQFK